MATETELKVKVLSPARPLAEVAAKSVLVPGSEGAMEVLPNHTAMIAEIGNGHLRVTKADREEKIDFHVAGGYVEVFNNSVQVLVDVAEEPTGIDKDRAKQALKRAEDRLKKVDANTDLKRALQAKARAQSRLWFLDHVTKLYSSN